MRSRSTLHIASRKPPINYRRNNKPAAARRIRQRTNWERSMPFMTISRRNFLHSSAGAAGLVLAGRPAFAALTKPSEPVTLNIVDIAGNLALTQKAFDNYRKAKPDWVSKIIFSK